MSYVIDSHNSLCSFKHKTKAFLLNNELILAMLNNKLTLYCDYNLC